MFSTVDNEDILQVTSTVKSGTSSDARESLDNSQVTTQNNNRELTVNMLVKELVLCIALALTTYGALHTSPTKISKQPQAVRFFSSDSVVIDWYKGQLSSALAMVNAGDVSFVMYYAPWDAESQYIRGEFEKAAIVLNDRVHFSAINCWHPGSECRMQHNKIPSWPILMAYTVTSRGVIYKGPRDAQSMVNFLELIMRPLERVSTAEDLVNLVSICDAVAVGYTPMTETSKYYNSWYHIALKSREFDTIGEICFAVVTSEELAMDLGVESTPNVRVMLWNVTKEYLTADSDFQLWNESTLIQFVLENFAQPVARIIPMWRKSFSFERYVDGNPILMLFTPLNPLYEQLPSYALLREVAMEYYNCNNNDSTQWTSELIKLQHVQRLLYQQKNTLKFCQEYKFKKPIRKQSKFLKKETESQYPWNNVTQKGQKNGVFNFLLKRGLDISKAIDSNDDETHLLSSLGLLHECNLKVLPAEKRFYYSDEKCQLYEDSLNQDVEIGPESREIETTMLPFEDDPLSPENLIQDNVKHFCKLFKFAYEWGPPVFPARVPNYERMNNITHINGLACANNFSMYMLAVDSVRNHHFAEALGIDILNKKDMTAVVILDSKHESQYVLAEEYSAKSVRDFIYNFTNKNLKRSLRSHIDDADHTHFFGSDGPTEQMGINNDTVHIIDLTTRSFRRMVNKPGKLTLVCVCGGACGALTSLALVGGARLLAAAGERVLVARLDALRHDLPWHYTVHHYPTVFVFPADRRVRRGRRAWWESSAYPAAGARVSAGGVAALGLRALAATPAHHLRVRLALCSANQAINVKKICLSDLKEHMTAVIGRNLKYWRRAERKELKDAMFKRLQHLHRVSLDLSVLHVTDLSENHKQASLLNSLSDLSKNWDIDDILLSRNFTPSGTS